MPEETLKPKCFATKEAIGCLNVECPLFQECTITVADVLDFGEDYDDGFSS